MPGRGNHHESDTTMTKSTRGSNAGEAPSQRREATLRTLYAAFNARDVESVLRHMTADVDWPNGWEGGRVHGHDGVRDYWTRQWSAIDPTVLPIAFTSRPDGSIAVAVEQVVRELDGALLSEGQVAHVYTFGDELITRMDIEDPAGGEDPAGDEGPSVGADPLPPT